MNLKTSEAWAIRENIKTIFSHNHWSDLPYPKIVLQPTIGLKW